jgi:hypothetical protein
MSDEWPDNDPNMPPNVKAEIKRRLDGYEADLVAALLKKPFPKTGEVLDLTPRDDDEEDEAE